MSRLRHLALTADVPYFACKYGYSDVEGYMQCDTCHRVSFCDLAQVTFQPALHVAANNPADAWEERRQKLDCFNGNALSPTFFHCFECPFTRSCELFNSTDWQIQQEVYHQNLRAKSIEDRATYYRDEFGVWKSAENQARPWRKVKKNKDALDINKYNACLAGDATHPKFWECKDCRIADQCPLYPVLQRKRAEVHQNRDNLTFWDKVDEFNDYASEHRAEIRAAKFQRTKDSVKRFFEKVADFFN